MKFCLNSEYRAKLQRELQPRLSKRKWPLELLSDLELQSLADIIARLDT